MSSAEVAKSVIQSQNHHMTDPKTRSEAEFLARYDSSAFAGPIVTVDAVLFTYHDNTLQVLTVRRSEHPERNKWGFPGGFVDMEADATLEDTVARVLRQKTGVVPPYLEQLASYGNGKRDKRGWSVTVCYTALIAFQKCEQHVESVADVQWLPLDKLARRSLAFDHKRLLADARERLKQKALYSIVPVYALPETFTLPELQELHEALIGKPLQKKSFRRRIEQAGLIEDTGEKRVDTGRPATLYRVNPGARDYTFLRNLEG